MDLNPVGMVFRKGDKKLQTAIAHHLQSMKAAREFEKIRDEWLPDLLDIPDAQGFDDHGAWVIERSKSKNPRFRALAIPQFTGTL